MVDQVRVGIDGQCSVPPGGTCDSNPDQAACVNKDRIDYLTVDASLSVGPVFACHLGHRMYRGEYFAMQTDVHVEFVKGWDDKIVDQWTAFSFSCPIYVEHFTTPPKSRRATITTEGMTYRCFGRTITYIPRIGHTG